MAFVPRVRDDQVQRISDKMHAKYPRVLVSRVNDQVVLVQGIAVKAECSQDADALTWERMQVRANLALCEPQDESTKLTSIDVTASGDLL